MRLNTALLIPFFLGACGSATPTVETPAAEPALADLSWEVLNGSTLRGYVSTQAHRALQEVMESATPEAVDRWLGAPDDAPALGGRASERLMELAAVALAAEEFDRAEGLVHLVRSKASNRNNAFAGNTILVESARRRGGDASAIAEVFRSLPPSRFGGSTVLFQIFQEQAQLDARLGQIHEQIVSLDTASGALYFEQVLPGIVANRSLFLEAIGTVQAELDAAPAREPYAFSTVDLSGDEGASAVHVAVWDVGTNPALFESQLFTNPNEQANGEDDDGNGLVDDVHGVVQDVGEYTHEALLYQPGEATLREYTPFLRGIMDLRAGIATSEAAQRVLGLMRSATDPESVERLETNLDAVGEWAHGTHVAGILLAGLPQAQLSIFRSSWAGEARLYHHRGPTDEELAAERANVDQIAAYINAHGVRVVNASLGFSLEYVASALRHQGDLYASDEAVMARAREIQAHRQGTWQRVFEQCPSTLFVVAAGNSNQDVIEYGDTPANIEASNVLVVGAVDRFGEWATFTNSNASRVRIFDFGVEVPSLIPDGSTVPLSGTSMASPNAANLAAKMIALNSELTPEATIAIMEETATPIAPPFGGRIANEEAALARVRAAQN